MSHISKLFKINIIQLCFDNNLYYYYYTLEKILLNSKLYRNKIFAETIMLPY